MCVRVPPSCLFLLLRAVSFYWFWLSFVSGYAFFCSVILNGTTSFWGQGLEFALWLHLWLGQMCQGAIAMEGPEDVLSFSLEWVGLGLGELRDTHQSISFLVCVRTTF